MDLDLPGLLVYRLTLFMSLISVHLPYDDNPPSLTSWSFWTLLTACGFASLHVYHYFNPGHLDYCRNSQVISLVCSLVFLWSNIYVTIRMIPLKSKSIMSFPYLKFLSGFPPVKQTHSKSILNISCYTLLLQRPEKVKPAALFYISLREKTYCHFDCHTTEVTRHNPITEILKFK